MDRRAEQEAELARRVTAEQEVARLTGLRDRLRQVLTAELGLTRWSERDNAGTAGCADFPDSRGVSSFLASLALEGGVPDAAWPRAAELVERTAAEYGFGAAQTVVDRPGQHEVVLDGERGTRLRVSSLLNATVALETGCHLPEGATPSRRPA